MIKSGLVFLKLLSRKPSNKVFQRKINFPIPVRIFYSPFYGFSDVIQEQKKVDRAALINKIKQIFDKKTGSAQEIQELQMLILQVKPYFPELDIQQFKILVNVYLQTGFFDQTTMTKVVDRSYYFYDTKQLSTENFFEIIIGIFMPQTQLNSDQIRIIQSILEKMKFNQISGHNLAYGLGIYAKMKQFCNYENQALQTKLIDAFTVRYGYLDQSNIGLAAISLAIIQVENPKIWEYVEDRTIQLIDNLSFPEFVTCATALGMHNNGTKYFWKQFSDQVIKKLNNLRPDEITQTLLLLVQAQKENDELYSCLEQAFLTRYNDFDQYNSVLAFACFGKLKRGSAIWDLFETDLAGFIEEASINEMMFMIPGVMNVSTRFSRETKNMLKSYVIKNGDSFLDEVKVKLKEQFKYVGLLDSQLESALEKSRIWNY